MLSSKTLVKIRISPTKLSLVPIESASYIVRVISFPEAPFACIYRISQPLYTSLIICSTQSKATDNEKRKY